MNNWLFRCLTVLGPGFAVMASILLEPDPELGTFWNAVSVIVFSSFVISLPQIVWAMVGYSGLLSREVYWGGLIAVQFWVVAFFVLLERRFHFHPMTSTWFFYFLSCVVLLLGAFCGFLFRKFQHKEPAA